MRYLFAVTHVCISSPTALLGRWLSNGSPELSNIRWVLCGSCDLTVLDNGPNPQ